MLRRQHLLAYIMLFFYYLMVNLRFKRLQPNDLKYHLSIHSIEIFFRLIKNQKNHLAKNLAIKREFFKKGDVTSIQKQTQL